MVTLGAFLSTPSASPAANASWFSETTTGTTSIVTLTVTAYAQR